MWYFTWSIFYSHFCTAQASEWSNVLYRTFTDSFPSRSARVAPPNLDRHEISDVCALRPLSEDDGEVNDLQLPVTSSEQASFALLSPISVRRIAPIPPPRRRRQRSIPLDYSVLGVSSNSLLLSSRMALSVELDPPPSYEEALATSDAWTYPPREPPPSYEQSQRYRWGLPSATLPTLESLRRQWVWQTLASDSCPLGTFTSPAMFVNPPPKTSSWLCEQPLFQHVTMPFFDFFCFVYCVPVNFTYDYCIVIYSETPQWRKAVVARKNSVFEGFPSLRGFAYKSMLPAYTPYIT